MKNKIENPDFSKKFRRPGKSCHFGECFILKMSTSSCSCMNLHPQLDLEYDQTTDTTIGFTTSY